MKRIRPLGEDDIPAVTALYERVVRSGGDTPPPGLADYFHRIFLGNPWTDDEIPSLVYEKDGRVGGFIGSHVRSLLIDGRPIRMACSGQLVTSPGARLEAAGAFLVAEYLAGPQELTITDGANEQARRLFERLGAETLHVSCIDWIRVFRPSTLAAEYGWRHRNRGVPRAAASLLGLVDAAMTRLPRVPFPPARPPGRREELTPEALCNELPTIARGFRLYPDYDQPFVDWLFRELAAVQSRGRLVRSLVRSEDGRVLGWYVLYVRPGGVSDVVQVVAGDRDTGAVLDHLFYEAFQLGVSAVRGRIEPRLLTALWGRKCVLRKSAGALAHSRFPEILYAIRGGRALLTRMEGEWWMGHHTEPFAGPEAPRSARPTVSSLGVELVDDLDLLREDWTRLAEANGNIFATWEWNDLWWRHFSRGRRPILAVCRGGGGQVAAIVPLYAWAERPLRILRFLGHGHGDLLGPICDSEAAETAIDALRRALHARHFDIFVGDLVSAELSLASALGGKILRETGYPIVRFGTASWDEFLASRSPSFRKYVRRYRRKLERQHEVSFRLCTDRQSLDGDLDVLFDLHRARFGDHAGCLFCGPSEAFQREFAACAFDRGWLRLWILETDGEPVAADYGFRFGDAEFGYQAGRDRAWDRASIGFVLQTHVLQEAIEGGALEYRMLQGDDPYKYRFATDDPELETIAVAGSPHARLIIAGTAAARRVPALAALAKRIGR